MAEEKEAKEGVDPETYWGKREHGPDAGDGDDQADPLYKWTPGEALPTRSEAPGDEQCWSVAFLRTGRHFEIVGNDTTFASKASRMIAARPMTKNEIGSEGWSFAGMGSGGWYRAYGPKAKLSLGSKAAHSKRLSDEVGFGGIENAKADPKTWAPLTAESEAGGRKARASKDQFTQIDGQRACEWVRIVTTDNTFATKIRKAAQAKGSDWFVFRDDSLGRIEAWCPKGCVRFRK